MKPVCHLLRFKSTETSIFPSDGRAATARRAWQPLSDHRETENGCVGREQSKGMSIYFTFSLELSLLIPLIFRVNWLPVFALMRAAPSPQTSLAARVARAAPETPLCESLQRCVKGKHVLHSESQGSLSLLISVMKCFPPPALRIQASALPQTNLSRGAHTCNNTTVARLHSVKAVFLFMSTTLSASCLVCW